MSGLLFITEYRNYGDVQWETAVEPADHAHEVPIGDLVDMSEPLTADTRLVALFATVPCLVAFLPENGGDGIYFPVAAETETLRLMHTNTKFRIAVKPRG
jgi:hypothetical protein